MQAGGEGRRSQGGGGDRRRIVRPQGGGGGRSKGGAAISGRRRRSPPDRSAQGGGGGRSKGGAAIPGRRRGSPPDRSTPGRRRGPFERSGGNLREEVEIATGSLGPREEERAGRKQEKTATPGRRNSAAAPSYGPQGGGWDPCQELLAVSGFRSHLGDDRAADAQIGQITIAQRSQFTHGLVIDAAAGQSSFDTRNQRTKTVRDRNSGSAGRIHICHDSLISLLLGEGVPTGCRSRLARC